MGSVHEIISLDKNLIKRLSKDYDSDSSCLILAGVCITLTKFTNSTDISITVDGKNLHFDDKNRQKSVFDYIHNLSQIIEMRPISEVSFNDFENKSVTLSFFPDSIKLEFDSDEYTNYYITTFLKSTVRCIRQFSRHDLKIKDIYLRDEEPAPDFKLKRKPLVNELLEDQARKTPEKTALIISAESYTFKEINDEANRIANALIKRGFSQGSSIGFLLKRSKTLITTFLGIIKAGCVAVPLDPNFAPEKLKYIIKNSDCEAIITFQDFENSISPDDLITEGDISFPSVDLKPDSPIFLLYTSGSTGNPKGVISTHCGISNLISVHIKTNYKRLLSISSISFDISEEDILVAMTNGIELVFADDSQINDIVLLSRLVESTEPEFVNITPSRILSYVQVPEFRQALTRFKGIGCGGELFTKKLYESIRNYTDCDIYNGYGPLETSLTSNSKLITNPDYITNGKPLLNYITDVRDMDGKLLPYGIMGELYIGGIGVSRGYYKLDEKNSQSFMKINGVRYYRTGDRAVQLASGEIIIRGRLDHQIKLRGQRVEVEEIENVIFRYGHMKDVVVMIQDINGEKHLCAYFTATARIETEDLREYLSEILSAYMVPTFFIQMESFPETTSGKMDRKNFPKPEIETENVIPSDTYEEKIYEFSSKIIDFTDFGVTDNLFKIGFTSLLIMKLNSDIYHEYGISLMHNEIIANPTVRHISELVKNNVPQDSIEKIEENQSGEYPMSSQQKRLYALYRNNPDLCNYNLPNVRHFKKPLNVKRLEDAINKVIDTEEILRTSLHIKNGRYIQKVHEKRDIHVDYIISEEDFGEELQKHIRPFALESEPLIRIKVIEHDGETYVFRDMHHILGDQISNDIFYQKVRDAYRGREVIPERIQYKDYACWAEKQKEKEVAFWKAKRISHTGTAIPEDFKRPHIQTFRGARISHDLDKKIIEKQARNSNTTVFKLLLSHFAVLLNRYLDEDEIQIGTVTSGRTHPDLQNTMGMFVNTLPLTLSLTGEDTLKDALVKTEKELSDIFDNQNYSIDRIISEHNIHTGSSQNPLFSVVFLQNTADGFEGELQSDDVQFDLTCKVKNSKNNLSIEFEYNTDIYSSERMSDILEHFVYLIENGKNNFTRKIKDIPILSPQYAQMIIDKAGVTDEISDESLLDLFKNCVAENPEKTALSDGEVSLTYRDLDMKSTSLAGYLKDKCGITKQDCVLLVAERSIESVLAFFAILRLNAVYVPVNSSFPKERIQYIASNVNAKVALTNSDLKLDSIKTVDLGCPSIFSYAASETESSGDGNLCILHTSGTTGVPKGVVISHDNMKNFLAAVNDTFRDVDFSVFYHTTGIGFDVSVFEILYPLLNATELFVINERYDFTKVPESVVKEKSMLSTVPSKMKMFLDITGFDEVAKSISALVLAGEILGENLIRQIQRNCNPVIYNAYGPAEATVFASIKRIISPDNVTIGNANVNTQIYILNSQKQISPIGVAGELAIAGKQVSKGYVGMADLTSQSFIDNPFGEGSIYLTGDLAYLGYDGEIHFIARSDSQIKIHGQRMEVEEINSLLEKSSGVRYAITVPNEEKTQLYSYIVCNGVADTDKIMNDLELFLPPFMIPSSIMQIESIPLNSNGKVDTEKLPKPEMEKNRYVKPVSEREKTIVAIWQKVLDEDNIGIHDNFYHLGGDSIKAIRIVSLLQNEGITVAPRDILNFKTPYLIAQNAVSKENVSHTSVEGRVELLPMQKYFFDEINEDSFSQNFTVKSHIDWDINTVQNAFDELTDIHDMLRASYKIENGVPVQEILPLNTRVCEIKEFEISHNPDELIKKIIAESRKSLNVSDRLIEASLIHFEDESYLVFVIHHLIIDGVSWSILLDDLSYILNQTISGGSSDIIRPYPYRSWARDIRKLVHNISDEERSHWMQVNSLLDDTLIRGNAKPFRFDIKNVSFDFNNMLTLSEEEFFALAIARAYKKTFSKDIVLNRESYGRDETLADVNRTVGWFTAQYPVYVKVNGNYDDISLMRDALSLKKAFKQINNLGLNYLSMIYTSGEMKYKHCPVTFNFLSTEFTFKNDLFESYDLKRVEKSITDEVDAICYGVSFNILNLYGRYEIYGSCAEDTYLENHFQEFIDNIRYELTWISQNLSNTLIFALCESQLEIYENEKEKNMGTAYSTWDCIECPSNLSKNDIKKAIYALIEKHPVLKGRISDECDMPLLICDSYPSVEITDTDDFSKLIKPFDLNEKLARFYILDKNGRKSIFYDIHHVINDGVGFSIIRNNLNLSFKGNLSSSPDLGFCEASRDSLKSKSSPAYESAHEFFRTHLSDRKRAGSLKKVTDGSKVMVSFPIHNIRKDVEKFAQNKNITVGIFLNAVFARTYSQFIKSRYVCYNFVEHGRHDRYSQNALGMFARTVPLLVDCGHEDYLEYFSDLLLNSMSNSIYPYRLLKKEFDLKNDVLFEYNYDLNDVSDIEDNIIIKEDIIDAFAEFFCIVNDLDDGYVIHVKQTDSFSKDTAIDFAELYAKLIIQMIKG